MKLKDFVAEAAKKQMIVLEFNMDGEEHSMDLDALHDDTETSKPREDYGIVRHEIEQILADAKIKPNALKVYFYKQFMDRLHRHGYPEICVVGKYEDLKKFWIAYCQVETEEEAEQHQGLKFDKNVIQDFEMPEHEILLKV